jgi:hypothetical protein
MQALEAGGGAGEVRGQRCDHRTCCSQNAEAALDAVLHADARAADAVAEQAQPYVQLFQPPRQRRRATELGADALTKLDVCSVARWRTEHAEQVTRARRAPLPVGGHGPAAFDEALELQVPSEVVEHERGGGRRAVVEQAREHVAVAAGERKRQCFACSREIDAGDGLIVQQVTGCVVGTHRHELERGWARGPSGGRSRLSGGAGHGNVGGEHRVGWMSGSGRPRRIESTFLFFVESARARTFPPRERSSRASNLRAS